MSEDHRPLIVGPAASAYSESRTPFTGQSGDRLRRLLPDSSAELSDLFELENLIPGKRLNGNGDRFYAAQAKRGAVRLIRERKIRPGRLVVAMGMNVARTICAANLVPHGWFHASLVRAPSLRFQWRDEREPKNWGPMAGEFWLLAFPHPSGVDHWWNEPANTAVAQSVMAALVEGDYLSLQLGVWCTACNRPPIGGNKISSDGVRID